MTFSTTQRRYFKLLLFCNCSNKTLPLKAFRSFVPAQLNEDRERFAGFHLLHVHKLFLCISPSAVFMWPSASTGCCWWDGACEILSILLYFEPLLLYRNVSAGEAITMVERKCCLRFRVCPSILRSVPRWDFQRDISLRHKNGCYKSTAGTSLYKVVFHSATAWEE